MSTDEKMLVSQCYVTHTKKMVSFPETLDWEEAYSNDKTKAVLRKIITQFPKYRDILKDLLRQVHAPFSKFLKLGRIQFANGRLILLKPSSTIDKC